ncbi:expressed unknown protein [Seminavis robusta]|uniref:EF-hand domain-containing protein n=1 Tax=Seminavis robusta TaxID=568900 RepID=A0A9N8DKT2_9STRA|nr:expressed unknown protein [Seminavis robusta]|eukprot:Sro112_g055540.1 n/a (256) ;mRNA; f:25821-26660
MAAASSAGRWRDQEARAKEHAVLRKKASHNRRVLKERTGEKFDDLSDDGEWLLESQINDLLALAMMRKEGSLHPDAVQLVVDTAHRLQEKDGLTPPDDKKGAMAKEPLMKAVKQYGEYIKNGRQIDAAFQKYDKEQDGYLSRKELMKLLQDRELKANRAKRGVAIRLMVTEEDIDWIIEESDADHTGKINHAEYLPAIAAWEELAQMKLEHPDKCIILDYFYWNISVDGWCSLEKKATKYNQESRMLLILQYAEN